MNKLILIILLLCSSVGLYAQTPVYIIEFENPTQNATSLTWDVRVRAASASFTLLSGNIRYNFNNSGLTTNTLTPPSFTITHPSFVLDGTNFNGSVPNRIVALNFSSPGGGALVDNSTGIFLGTVTHLKQPSLPSGTLANVRIREFNVPGYTNPLPNSTVNSTTNIFTQASPFNPVQAGVPVNLDPMISLPVNLKSFSAEKAGERMTRLDWVSATEINVSHYEVERSFDALFFERIGNVDAVGNSTTESVYQLYDRKIPDVRTNTIIYYRLKMVDLDGSFKYSDIRGVNFGGDQISGVRMYPNPTNSFLNLDINVSSFAEEKGDLKVFDALGKLILSKKVIGNGIETIDMGRMTNGVYHVVLTQGEQVFKEKIVKID